MNAKLKALSTWNYGASALHLGAALLTIFLLSHEKTDLRTVTTYRTAYDEETANLVSKVDLSAKLVPESVVDIKYLLVAFFGITSLAHYLYANDFFGRGLYSKEVLGYGWNPFRWIEYSLSAGIMIYLISIVSGTKDQVSAMSAALITPGLMINGLTTERELNQNAVHEWSLGLASKPKIDALIILSNMAPAWFLFGVKWYIILSNYAKLSKEAKAAGNPVDPAVSFMVYSQLFFFSLFGVIQTYQVYRWLTLRSGRIEPSFVTYEKAYIVLSATTKLILAGTILYAIQ